MTSSSVLATGSKSQGLTRRHPESRLLLMPGYDAFNDLINALDPVSLAEALKDNPSTLYQPAKDRLDSRPADSTSGIETGHGRIEWRHLRVCEWDLDAALFPGARQLVSITRHHCEKKSAGDFKNETRHFLTTLRESDASHARLVEIGCKHWSVENKNHWRKDATVWREDRGGRRTTRGAKNLALLRNAILALIEPGRHASLNQAFLHYADHRAEALRLITKPPRSIPSQPIALIRRTGPVWAVEFWVGVSGRHGLACRSPRGNYGDTR